MKTHTHTCRTRLSCQLPSLASCWWLTPELHHLCPSLARGLPRSLSPLRYVSSAVASHLATQVATVKAGVRRLMTRAIGMTRGGPLWCCALLVWLQTECTVCLADRVPPSSCQLTSKHISAFPCTGRSGHSRCGAWRQAALSATDRRCVARLRVNRF